MTIDNINVENLKINYINSIYSIDTINSMYRKLNQSKFELLKENFIHSFSTATVLVKEML